MTNDRSATRGDDAMRALASTMDAPEFSSTSFTKLNKPLSECRVAIVTSASLHRPDQERFSQGDTGFRAFDQIGRAHV